MTHALQLQACIEVIQESGRDVLIDQLCQAIALSEAAGKNIRPQVRRVLKIVAPGLNEMTAFIVRSHVGWSRDAAIAELYTRLDLLAETNRSADFQAALAELRGLQTEEADQMHLAFLQSNPLSIPGYLESAQKAKDLLSRTRESTPSTNDPSSSSDR